MSSIAFLVALALPTPINEAIHPSSEKFIASYHAVYMAPGEVRIEASGHSDEGDNVELAVSSPNNTNGINKHLQDFKNALNDGIWCDTVHRQIKPGSVKVIRQSEDVVVYTFQRATTDASDKDEVKYSKVAVGEVIVVRKAGAWHVTQIKWQLSKPLKPFMFVNIPRIDITTECARAPNGRSFAARTESIVEGSAFGKDVGNHTVLEITELSIKPE